MSYKTRPEAMVYDYRLSGYEAEWQSTHAQRVKYLQLPPGEYTITALSDSNGCFTEEDVHVSVEEGKRHRADLLIYICMGG